MKKHIKLLIAVFTLIIISISADEKIYFANNKVSFIIPKDFKIMSKENIKKKYSRGTAPEFVYSNEQTTSTIAYGYTPNADLNLDNLFEFQKFIENTYNRMIPGIKWIKKEIIEINHYKWIFFEIESNAIDTEIHNIILMSAIDNGLISFNFNSVINEFDVYQKVYSNCIETISVKQD